MFKKVLGTVLLASSMFAASASATDYGTMGAHDADESGIFSVLAPGAFTDRHYFTLGAPYTGTESIFVSLNWTGATIINSSVSLMSGFGADQVEYAYKPFDGTFTGFDDVLLANNLASGEYYFEVRGVALNNVGALPTNPSTPQVYGIYAFSSTLSLSEVNPVPEANTYAMMLAGLTVMGFVGRRRRALK